METRPSIKMFFDTEFTGLHKDTTLISIGVTTEAGTTFYAELTDYDKDQIDPWIKENVIDKLKFKDKEPGIRVEPVLCCDKSFECKGDKAQVRQWFRDWMDQYILGKHAEVEFISDVCHYDMVLLIDLLVNNALKLPSAITPACYDINQDIAKYKNITSTEAFNYSREELLKELGKTIEGDKHNALYDAKVIKEIYLGIRG